MKSRREEQSIGPAYHPKTPTPTPSRALPGQAWNRKRLWRCVGKQEVTVGSGCLCSLPLPLLVNSSPAFYGDLVSPQPHPLPALGLVGSWVLLLDLSFLVWEGLAHMQAGKLGPREARKVTWLSAAAPQALQVRWKLSPSRRSTPSLPPLSPLSLSKLFCTWGFLSMWSVPCFSPPQTRSRCPGSQWGSQHLESSPPSSLGTVACHPAAAASGCRGSRGTSVDQE